MIIHKNLRLCGGTFFFLLLKANDSSEASQDLRFKYFLNVVDPDAVKDLMDGEVEKLHTYASNFRNGRKVPKKGKYIRLGNQQVCSIFKDEVATDKMAALNRVKLFVDAYIPERSRLWLVRALLELIHLDESIPDNKMFYTKPGFLPTYKSELMVEDADISFYDFLLGIWFYVYENYDDNSIGERTIKSLSTEVRPNVQSEFSAFSIGVSEKFQSARVSFDFGITKDGDVEEKEDRIVFLTEDDIVPDLSSFAPENDIVFVSAKEVKGIIKGKFAKYMAAAYKKHSNKRTFIYDTERPFRDFYVCNDISKRVHAGIVNVRGEVEILNGFERPFQYSSICDFQNLRNMIVGQGGLGKTMLVNHIFLTTIGEYETEGCLPIVTTLSDYIPKEKDLLFLICQAVTRYDSKLQLSDIIEQLDEGHTVVLLDGLDEVKKEYVNELIKELEYLGDLYPDNAYIISSRNIPEIRLVNNYSIYDLLPLTEPQAFEMVEKLDPMYIDDEVKKRFIRDVKNRRFRFSDKEKKEFFGNPLFLTIMLISYSQTNNIPTQRYLFYEQAYRALATKHDGLKGITRNFFTSLNEREFQKVFGQFCADSYADYQLKFERPLLDKYLQKVIDDNNLDTTADMFFKDITEKLCLMYLDGTEYRFIHRSFQEYFAAYYFTTLMDDEYKDVYDVLSELDSKIVSDETISMLYGLDSKKCEKYVIIPFIESFVEYEEDKESCDYDDEYKDFVLRFYSEIEYVTGELDDEMTNNQIRSALYKFLVENYKIKRDISGIDFDNDEGWADHLEKYYQVIDYRSDHKYGECFFESSLLRFIDDEGNPYEGVEISDAGYLCTVDMHKVAYLGSLLKDDRWDAFKDSSFPLREEFDDIIKLLKELKGKWTDAPKKRKRFGLGN